MLFNSYNELIIASHTKFKNWPKIQQLLLNKCYSYNNCYSIIQKLARKPMVHSTSGATPAHPLAACREARSAGSAPGGSNAALALANAAET